MKLNVMGLGEVNLTTAQLVEAFQEGFVDSVKDPAAQNAAFDRMLALVPDVKEGSTLSRVSSKGERAERRCRCTAGGRAS